MPFPFQKIQLEADSLYALINTWAEMQLIVTEDGAKIIGYGYTKEIAGAFSILVFDWEATIFLTGPRVNIPTGSYDLIREENMLFACQDQHSYPLPDQLVRVEVVSVPEG